MNVVPHGGRKALGRRSAERRGARKNFSSEESDGTARKVPVRRGKERDGGRGERAAKGRAGKGVGLARDLGSRGLPKGASKKEKDGGADDESGGVQVGGWRQRPVVEVPCGKSGGDSSGSLPHGGAPAQAGRAARVERRTGERPAAGAGGSRGRRGKRDCLSWPNR